MLTIIIGSFLILHGLVHLLYLGQSSRFFELRPNMIWPNGSWLFWRLLGNETTRWLASISLALAALGFISGGLGLLLQQDWWKPLTLGSAIFSSTLFLLLWDGRLQSSVDQGGVGLLINLTVLLVITIRDWPS